mgnify:CR=1 FL=1
MMQVLSLILIALTIYFSIGVLISIILICFSGLTRLKMNRKKAIIFMFLWPIIILIEIVFLFEKFINFIAKFIKYVFED